MKVVKGFLWYSKTCLRWPLKKKTKIVFQYGLSLNAGQKYCRMRQGEHSAILSTFIKPLFIIKILVLPIFEWPLKTGFTIFLYRWWNQREKYRTNTERKPCYRVPLFCEVFNTIKDVLQERWCCYGSLFWSTGVQ